MIPEEIYPTTDQLLPRSAKEERLGQQGRVFWLYGLSGSGKTTIAASFERLLHEEGFFGITLDGDNVRSGLNKDLGFGDEDPDEDEVVRTQLLSRAEPDDLKRFGLIPELVGRLPVMVSLEELDEEALIRILQEPRNALVKQYIKMLEMEGIGLTFDPDAIRAIAQKAFDRGTGARGLRAVIEGIMRDVMFDVPSRRDIREVVVTPEAVKQGGSPLLVFDNEAQQKGA